MFYFLESFFTKICFKNMSTGTFIGMAHHKKLTERKQRPK